MDNAPDSTRRAVFAALAGGLALAAPSRTEGKQGKKGKKGKPKPPPAFVAVVVDGVVPEVRDGVAGFSWDWTASFFTADGQQAGGPSGGGSFVPLGEDPRPAIADDARADAGSVLGIPGSPQIAVQIL